MMSVLLYCKASSGAPGTSGYSPVPAGSACPGDCSEAAYTMAKGAMLANIRRVTKRAFVLFVLFLVSVSWWLFIANHQT